MGSTNLTCSIQPPSKLKPSHNLHTLLVCYAQGRCVCISNSLKISSVVSVLHPFTAPVSGWTVYWQLDDWACSSLHVPATHCSWRTLESPLWASKRTQDVHPPQRCSAQGAQEKQPLLVGPLGPKAPSDILGSGVRKAAWIASWRARRAGKKEAETA